MPGRRFLIMHVTPRSGHHRASQAIERTVRRLDPQAHVTTVDAFGYTSPLIRWAIWWSYLSLIRHQPDVWEYLYDNPRVHRRVERLRSLLHRYHAAKLHALLARTQPEAIACTQAYPCGMVADFKRHAGLAVPLIGILTDYAPHLYWFHDTVDLYVVPSEEVKQRFVDRGVAPERVRVLGIPIDPGFSRAGDDGAETAKRYGLDRSRPIILVMGGGSGFGQLREIVVGLDLLPQPCQFVVVTGTNRGLLSWLARRRFRHPVVGLGYVEDVAPLMGVATLLISKPGGLTTSEALASRVPLVIVNPIPGQEAYNARYLLSHAAAVQAESVATVRQTVRDLLDNPERLAGLREHIAQLARPSAAVEISRTLFELANGRRVP